ncbi:MAG: cytochrome B5 [Deltaproteobacteria bacterium RIFCSPLOWO2_12_FULL_43_16]|nr:MAG: cytochrome B5 [Deltaproteobacteria bacterium GWA2_43_19]OGQ13039.1 MAG: cytochrome B5 [Deltaproteobacteria bacterium RIFCSPHIGHO2_02_FULL_43_33]OGQ39830.1 MAG: cytochrome B5 [Deltaproteobacteria bacterium RIFCSPLOWO2_01_FULL_42_9]OGQ57341.1 MAG: cytochrome B5 [Deltaproteobacteria bacterium RIFCSPLOWO2_12_FULL_43_16]HBR17216.1 cytochrome B5 [Deltaproteobacteria bacterium]
MEKRRFRKKELEQYNGKDGVSTFISYKEKIYDVSSSFLWQNGKHQALHDAGVDLTHCLGQAPHGEELLERFPIVGTLQEC